MNAPYHIRLFDQVEIVLNVVGSKLKSTVEPDGTIHFNSIAADGSILSTGSCSFNVFWSNQRQNRELFDREVLEQLIMKRVQDFQNEIALVPVVITRVQFNELLELQRNLDKQLGEQFEGYVVEGLKQLDRVGDLGQYTSACGGMGQPFNGIPGLLMDRVKDCVGRFGYVIEPAHPFAGHEHFAPRPLMDESVARPLALDSVADIPAENPCLHISIADADGNTLAESSVEVGKQLMTWKELEHHNSPPPLPASFTAAAPTAPSPHTDLLVPTTGYVRAMVAGDEVAIVEELAHMAETAQLSRLTVREGEPAHHNLPITHD